MDLGVSLDWSEIMYNTSMSKKLGVLLHHHSVEQSFVKMMFTSHMTSPTFHT